MITLSDPKLSSLTPEELGNLLLEAKKAYYTGGKPIMDDHTYDTLEDVLRHKSPHHRFFSSIGTPNFDTGWPKKKHPMPLMSQNKVSSHPDLIHYFELKKLPPNTDLVAQPKCDGLSLEIVYQKGKFTEAITRGDGKVGDVISQNVVKMQHFVPRLPQDLSCSVRCEIVVTKPDFKKLNQAAKRDKEGDFYSNPRNAASGISQRL